jgi:hypothetical protein
MLHEFVYFSNHKRLLFTEKNSTISTRCLRSGKYKIEERLFLTIDVFQNTIDSEIMYVSKIITVQLKALQGKQFT